MDLYDCRREFIAKNLEAAQKILSDAIDAGTQLVLEYDQALCHRDVEFATFALANGCLMLNLNNRTYILMNHDGSGVH